MKIMTKIILDSKLTPEKAKEFDMKTNYTQFKNRKAFFN